MNSENIIDESGGGVVQRRDDFSDITATRIPAQLTPASTAHARTGTVLRITIFTENWDKAGTIETLNCGSFEICGMRISGPPSITTIEAISLSLQSPIRREEHSKGWESVSLRQIAEDVAKRGNLILVYELDEDPRYDRVDQRRESDLSFLTVIAREQGAAVKVIGNQLVLYSEEKYETKPSVLTIKRGDKGLLSYSFSQDSSNTASSAMVTYKDPDSGKLARAIFPEEGDTASAIPGPLPIPAVANAINISVRPATVRETDGASQRSAHHG
jgi:hypothetical protein